MVRQLFLLTLGTMALAACASSSAPSSQRASKNAATQQSFNQQIFNMTEAPDLGAVGQYGIPSGRCGMILYTQSGGRAVPIFRSTDDGAAIMQIEGRVTQLRLVGRGGEARLGIPNQQYFQAELANGMGVTIAASARWGNSFPSGTYVERGTITATGADGWSRVVPIAGIAGCKA